MTRNASQAIICLAMVCAFLALPAAPAAAGCPNDVPDNSEVDQYQETIPSACGDQGTSDHGDQGAAEDSDPSDGSKGQSAGSALPSDVSSDLSQLGSDGRAVADLVASTGSSSSGQGGGGGPRSETGGTVADGSGSVVDALAEGATGSEGGLGLVGVFIIASSALCLGILGWRLVRR